MVRLVIIGLVVAAAFTLYALVDAAMSDAARAKGVSKPVWVVLVVVLPVIGGILWFTLGKHRGPLIRSVAPEDQPHFASGPLSTTEIDARVHEFEERLRELDEEVFPGEHPATQTTPTESAEADEAGAERSDPESDMQPPAPGTP